MPSTEDSLTLKDVYIAHLKHRRIRTIRNNAIHKFSRPFTSVYALILKKIGSNLGSKTLSKDRLTT